MMTSDPFDVSYLVFLYQMLGRHLHIFYDLRPQDYEKINTEISFKSASIVCC